MYITLRIGATLLVLWLAMTGQSWAQNQNGEQTHSFIESSLSLTSAFLHNSGLLPSSITPSRGELLIPEYQVAFLGLRYRDNGHLKSSIGGELSFSYLALNQGMSKGGYLKAGISRANHTAHLGDSWRLVDRASLGYMTMFLTGVSVPSSDKTISPHAHGLYLSDSWTLTRQLSGGNALGLRLGVTAYYLFNWQYKGDAIATWAKRPGFGLYPTLGLVFQLGK